MQPLNLSIGIPAGHTGSPNGDTQRGEEGKTGRGKEGYQQMPLFQKPDAAAVSTDDASTVSAPTLLDDQLRTL